MSSEKEQTFDYSWLRLREPADHQSRSLHCLKKLQTWTDQKADLTILDLGAGTGSNLRYLAPKLGMRQNWVLIDNDESLLNKAEYELQEWSYKQNAEFSITHQGITIAWEKRIINVRCQKSDINRSIDTLITPEIDLVTASALLDLCSAQWLKMLAEHCIKHRIGCFFALNYNGYVEWQEPDVSDTKIHQWFNEHQHTDKGFGQALGPDSTGLLTTLLADHYNIFCDSSNWHLQGDSQALQLALLGGWQNAAKEIRPDQYQLIDLWAKTKTDKILDTTTIQVGHSDFLALPK